MLLASALLLTLPSLGGPDDPVDGTARTLDPLLERVVTEHDVPALGALLWAEGGVYALGASGVRRAGGRERATADDRWHLGACSQTVTATLVAALVARGELSWETTLGESLVDLQVEMFPGYRDLPLELVLAHRAGLPYLPRRYLREALAATGAAPPMQRRRVAEEVLARRPLFVPGTRTGYSLAGYTVVGAAVEAVVEEPFEVLVQREVFDVLGMESAGLGAPGIATFVDEPWGHFENEDGRTPVPPGPDADLPSAFAPASSVHCTLRDAAKLAALHLALARGEETPFTAAVADRLRQPAEGPYTLGWLVTELDARGLRVLAHSGGNQRWYASFTLLPELDVAVIVTCNQGGRAGAAACRDAAAGLLGTYLRETAPSAPVTPSETPSTPRQS